MQINEVGIGLEGLGTDARLRGVGEPVLKN